jgi:aerobic-type carbon monoxide dehydrogenase small subunit (CoxS/CutS family)
MLNGDPQPSRDKIIAQMDHNICRCGAHQRIVAAIEQVVEKTGSGQ